MTMDVAQMNLARVIGSTFLILFFYSMSISLTFYNKWMSKRIHFPLTVSMIHFAVVFLLASIVRSAYEVYHKRRRIVLEWKVYITKCFPTAIAGSLDIGLSNWSIMLSTISLYTMAKSTTIAFIVVFSLMFGLVKLDRYLFLAVLFIAAGLILFTYESQQFDLLGFIMALTASVMGGIRWTTTQLILQKKDLGIHNPFDAIYHIQPVMALTMVVLAFVIEGTQLASSEMVFCAVSIDVAMLSLVIILSGAVIAFLLTVSEYLLIKHTSSITMAVASILKELVTLTLAAEIGGDKWSKLNLLGLVICMTGITIHVIRKVSQETDQIQMQRDMENMALTSLITADNDSEDDLIFDARWRQRRGSH